VPPFAEGAFFVTKPLFLAQRGFRLESGESGFSQPSFEEQRGLPGPPHPSKSVGPPFTIVPGILSFSRWVARQVVSLLSAALEKGNPPSILFSDQHIADDCSVRSFWSAKHAQWGRFAPSFLLVDGISLSPPPLSLPLPIRDPQGILVSNDFSPKAPRRIPRRVNGFSFFI